MTARFTAFLRTGIYQLPRPVPTAVSVPTPTPKELDPSGFGNQSASRTSFKRMQRNGSARTKNGAELTVAIVLGFAVRYGNFARR